MQFFFTQYQDKWWEHLDRDGRQAPVQNEDLVEHVMGEQRRDRLLEEFREPEMTPALQMLLTARRVRTEQEIEQEYQKRQKMIATGQIQVKQSRG